MPATVATIEYDPNRTARIALLHYADGEKRYILAPDGLEVGTQLLSSRNADIKPGNSLTLRFIPPGTSIHNVELRKGKGGQLVRSAGVAAQLMAKDATWAQVRLPSGEIRKVVHLDCRAHGEARCRTATTRTSASERLAARGGSGVARTTAA